MPTNLDQSERMLLERLQEHPWVMDFIRSDTFKKGIAAAVKLARIDPRMMSYVEHEVLFVLGLCTPVSQLAKNIAESCQVPYVNAKSCADTIFLVLLAPVYDELVAVEKSWGYGTEVQQPQITQTRSSTGQSNVIPQPPRPTAGIQQPLTREEVLAALSPKRTMASDIQALGQEQTYKPPQP